MSRGSTLPLSRHGQSRTLISLRQLYRSPMVRIIENVVFWECEWESVNPESAGYEPVLLLTRDLWYDLQPIRSSILIRVTSMRIREE